MTQMKYSYNLSDAVHLLSYLYIYQNGDLSSKAIANSIEANPSVVRSLMSSLRKAGLIISQQGVAGAKLAKDPAQINLLKVYQAIDTNHNLLHVDPKTNPKCIVGAHIQDTLNKVYGKIQHQAEKQMQDVTLQAIIDDILNSANLTIDQLPVN